jgi:feruloyl esterase
MAMASGNGGHVAASAVDGSWAVDRSLLEDSAYESEHQLQIVAKAVIADFYGQGPAHSYFSYCSNGGRQALVLAQRYPSDFDGIIAGAPANITMPLVVFSLGWNYRANTAADGSEIIKLADLPVLHVGAIAACDSLDGLTDGLIADPLDCTFDPSTLQCPGGEPAAACLSAAQVEAARKIYEGALDENGHPFYPGGMAFGSELAWAGWIVRLGDGSAPAAAELFSRGWLRYQPSQDPTVSLDIDDVTFDAALFDQLRPADRLGAATDPDLSAFRDAGGKLIIWHGWNDPAIPASGSVAYYNAVTDTMGGPEATGEFARLFLIPGMYHCAGGDGPSVFDMLTPMLNWVEDGVAPDRIVAAQLGAGNTVVRTRPVFPYPQVAVWDGTGNPDDQASFGPAPTGAHDIGWRETFTPGGRDWCHLENGELVCGPDRGEN